MRPPPIIVLSLAIALPALGYTPEYAPFDEQSRPEPFTMQRVEPVPTLDASTLFFPGRSHQLRISVLDDPDSGSSVIASIANADGEDVAAPVTVFEGGGMLPVEAFVGDLNRDGREDFAAYIPSGGNGLGAVHSRAAVALSSPRGHHFSIFETWFADANDFISTGDRGAAIMRMLFVEGEPGKDGRTHNYWAFVLHPVEGDRVVTGRVLPGYPKWVMYTIRANHRETDQLTDEQKQRLLANRLK